MKLGSLCAVLAPLLVACAAPRPSPAVPKAPVVVTPPPVKPAGRPEDAAPVSLDLDSKDILARDPVATEVMIKHVLFGWHELAGDYGGAIDPRADKRTQKEAAQLAILIADRLRKNPKLIDAMVEQFGEDPGMKSGTPYTVRADRPFIEEFKALCLRLNESEVGIVKTTYGYHVVERVVPPPPDPLQSADILARPAEAGPVLVQHVLIAWSGVAMSKSIRTKPEADEIAKKVLDEAAHGADMAKLMLMYSEDPGSHDDGKAYTVKSDSPMVEPFKALALRLKVGEVGLVKSDFGWHVMKRIAPPPPDALESVDILKREPPAAAVKVKHILVSWRDMKPDDPRAQKRDRKALEKLVKATVTKLKKGAAIEPLMKQLSEDPGSAESGEAYDVETGSPMVEPFKNLSLRLQPDEVGVVKTEFGIHIIKRVP